MTMRTALVIAPLLLASSARAADLAPNSALFVDGIPAIADSVVAEAGPYAESRSASWRPSTFEPTLNASLRESRDPLPAAPRCTLPGGARR